MQINCIWILLINDFVGSVAKDGLISPIIQYRCSSLILRRNSSSSVPRKFFRGQCLHVWKEIIEIIECFSASFYPSCLLEWNKLPQEIRESPTIGIFKHKLISLIRPPPKPVYSIHDPRGLAILTQLRVGLSMLNLHKFRHNFRDTLNPMCPSNDGVEDTEHFLLHCHSYNAYRTDLLDSINSTLQPYDLPNLSNALMLKLILYGDERLSVDSNSEILKATLRYIYATQRFE